MEERFFKTDEQWRELLTPEQFRVTRRQGTEPPFKNQYWDDKTPGRYLCVCCGQELFDSDHKFDSGTGWPSFDRPIGEDRVQTETDRSLAVERTEVHCARCGAHLGHLFDDGPPPTRLRYCINSTSLNLRPRH